MEKSALASAKRASVAVGAFFQNAGKDTVVELARARCVFPKAVVPFVSAALTQRVVEVSMFPLNTFRLCDCPYQTDTFFFIVPAANRPRDRRGARGRTTGGA